MAEADENREQYLTAIPPACGAISELLAGRVEFLFEIASDDIASDVSIDEPQQTLERLRRFAMSERLIE